MGFIFSLSGSPIFLPAKIFLEWSENGKVAMLVGNLKDPLLSDEAKETQINEIVKYYRSHRGTHFSYALRFFALEVYNFTNVICQMYFIDFFLGGEFQTYE